MNPPENHNEVMFMLGEIKAGIAGVNDRLDKVNGRLNKHDELIQCLNSYRDTQRGEFKIISIMWGSISAIIVSIVVFVLTKEV
jgi:hypothetical protein